MTTFAMTRRQQREAEYYRQFMERNPVETIDFAPVLSDQRRPWSPYWSLCRLVRDLRTDEPQRLLDFGCGWGVSAVSFARLGYQVEGFDVAPANIAAAEKLATRYNLDQQCRFRVMPAEKLDYPDNHFDVAVGIDILHHVELAQALPELARVLKPNGVAILKEPYAIPLLEWVRETRLLQALAPRETSFDKHVHITDDERKLTCEDIRLIEKYFHIESVTCFSLLNRLSRFLPQHYSKLMWLDYTLFRLCPPLRRLGDVRLYQCRPRNK